MSLFDLLPNISEGELKQILDDSIFSRTRNEKYHVWSTLSYIVVVFPPKFKKLFCASLLKVYVKSNMLVIIEIGEIHPKLLFSVCRKVVWKDTL